MTYSLFASVTLWLHQSRRCINLTFTSIFLNPHPRRQAPHISPLYVHIMLFHILSKAGLFQKCINTKITSLIYTELLPNSLVLVLSTFVPLSILQQLSFWRIMVFLLISISSYFPINVTLKLTQVSTLYDACLIWNSMDRLQSHTWEVLNSVHYNATFNEILPLTYWGYKILNIYRSCWIHDYYPHSSKSWKLELEKSF